MLFLLNIPDMADVSEMGDIVEISKGMLMLAKAGKWDELFSVEKMRADKIARMDFTERDRLLIEQVIQLDIEVRQLAEKQRSALFNELKNLNKGKSALNAYAP